MQGGGGGQGGDHIMRILAGAGSALAMSLLMIALFWFVPQHKAKLVTEGPDFSKTKVSDGVWEQKDFFGLIDTQWTIANGVAEGDALQYYANGSLLREMTYRNGRLDGEVREYHEKGPYRRPPVRGRLATAGERLSSAGEIRKVSYYRDGGLVE